MESAPENPVPIFVPQKDIDSLFDELQMPKFLNHTCNPVQIGAESGVAAENVYPFGNKRVRRAAWRKENFIGRNGESYAIVYWRKLPNGDEERRVQQFTAPDGRFFVVDSLFNGVVHAPVASSTEAD